MGMTIGCARCHNHKFDPISIQDYYALTAVFQDIEFLVDGILSFQRITPSLNVELSWSNSSMQSEKL